MSKLQEYLEMAEGRKTLYSDIKVDRTNFKKFKFINDYRDGALERLSNEELKAQVFHQKDLKRGTKGPIRVLYKLSLRSIAQEFLRRGIVPKFTTN